ncbi:MAG: hypothetical protein IJY20_00200 [Clostridia bacterium]|nr:hypothetical protein [Clostridia bacterium]
MERGAKKEAGVVMLLWETDFPVLPEKTKGEQRIAAFYHRLEEETKAFLDQLEGIAREEYTTLSSPRKRFSFSFYRLSVSVTVTEESADFFSAVRHIRLLRGGKILAERQAAEVFLQHTGALCTPFSLRLRGFRIPRGKGDLYIKDGVLCRLADKNKPVR